MKLNGETRLLMRQGMLYQPELTKMSKQDIGDMTSVLFLPGDVTQLKSTIRRIILDLSEIGYKSSQGKQILEYENIEKIAKVVTTAVALEKLSSKERKVEPADSG